MCCVAAIIALTAPTQGREIFVSPSGSVNATGTQLDPFVNIRVAVGHAIDGDVIVLFPGTYSSRDIEVYDVKELHFKALDPSKKYI